MRNKAVLKTWFNSMANEFFVFFQLNSLLRRSVQRPITTSRSYSRRVCYRIEMSQLNTDIGCRQGSESGGSGCFLLEAEAQPTKNYSFRFRLVCS